MAIKGLWSTTIVKRFQARYCENFQTKAPSH